MFKSLLVPLLGEDCDDAVLDTARHFGRAFDAHLDCLHTEISPFEMATRLASMDAATTAPVIAELWKSLEDESVARAASAKKAFERLCAAHNVALIAAPPLPACVSGSYRENEGDVVRAVVAAALTHDVVVLGRSEPVLDARGIGVVLVSSGRPVLLAGKRLPQDMFDTVAIAWKDTAEAARALACAMPILAKARKIIVLGAAENGRSTASERASLERAAEYLRWHGFSPETACLSAAGDAYVAVMDTAAKASAGLLVMGGYGHSRLGEFVFGGFTSSVLDGAELPVFMSH